MADLPPEERRAEVEDLRARLAELEAQYQHLQRLFADHQQAGPASPAGNNQQHPAAAAAATVPPALFALPDAVVLFDRQGRCREAHVPGPGPFLVGAEQLPGRTLAGLLPAEPARWLGERIARVRAGSGLEVLEYELPLPDGPRSFEARLVPFGPLVLGIFRDVTERARREQERHQRDTWLQEVQGDSLGTLAGGLAHNFNNLLTTVLGFASLAAMELPAASPIQPYLAQVEQAGRRAAELCQQLLAYAGRGRFVLVQLDLSAAVRSSASVLQATVPPQARLSLELAEDLPPVLADPAQMRQVVLNLVVNASEALGGSEAADGQITVQTARVRAERPDLVGLRLGADLPAGEYVLLRIADTGCGMDEATQARLFEPFFSTKFIGRGLGLPAILGIVRAHHGGLRVSSGPGRGTTVEVFLPPAPARP
jgi:signal transduction histidine kinase